MMSAIKPEETTNAPSAIQLPKAYDPSIIEDKWAKFWVDEKIFNLPTPPAAGLDADTLNSAAFTMLLPPPNVTGRLHMGHMLNQTEMDILTRWHRMCGDTALWVPGTDHAGIATQMMVERQLTTEGITRKALGREAFTERVWAWKEQYGSAITDQMKRLGASVDWSREYFTMDDNLNVAVREAFVRLYEQGLIYRGAYIVNWDPIQQTAVSDLEVTHEDRLGKLFHIRYDLVDGTGSITIATTRPETLLGDTAVAVNPTDQRYRHLIGKLVTLPLTNRTIPILADDWAQPEFGTGAVKVTPAHDPNDFAIGQRHALPSLTILDTSAHIDLPGSPYHGLDRFAAREKIVEDLAALGLLVAVHDHNHAIAISQRSGAVIEPRLSMQWFLAVNKQPAKPGAPFTQSEVPDAPFTAQSHRDVNGSATALHSEKNSIAGNAIAAVRDGHIKFTPEMYEKTYFEWMANIHDWCISRQLWWGHRIPAWHCGACDKITVTCETPAVCSGCGITDIRQETDVLDTWFSSGLLPFTVFGWPGEQGSGPSDLAAFYPTSLLVTGFDILFFWVARMIMLGTHFMLDVPMQDGRPRALAEAIPFKAVYIHALVRDANREKMSKTKGNVIDPIGIVEKYGTDAVRFTLASMASPGTDIAFSEARTEGNRAFANKIWNAARFLFMNLERAREAGIHIDLATNPGAPFIAPSAMGGLSSEARPSSFTAPIVPDHTLTGELAHLIAASTPQGEATFLTGNPDATNPTVFPETSPAPAQTPLESRWILTRLSETCAAVDISIATYRFDEAANHVYQFFWGDLCDWYLEVVKLRLIFHDPARTAETAAALTTLVQVFESALRLLSPFMPFLTEEIWHALYAGAAPAKSIALTRYPKALDYPSDPASVTGMQTLQELITTVRALRKEITVPEKESTPISLHAADHILALADANADMLSRMARVASIAFATEPLSGSNARSTSSFDISIIYERQIDIPAERERLTKDLAKYEKGLLASDRQLTNEAFMAKAPAPIVEGLRTQAAETRTLYDKTKAALDALNERPET